MKVDKKLYLTPEFCVTSLCTESCVCVSNLGALINATDEESDGNEWPSIN